MIGKRTEYLLPVILGSILGIFLSYLFVCFTFTITFVSLEIFFAKKHLVKQPSLDMLPIDVLWTRLYVAVVLYTYCLYRPGHAPTLGVQSFSLGRGMFGRQRTDRSVVFESNYRNVRPAWCNDCSMLISGLQKCYKMIDIVIPQEHLRSIMDLYMDYMRSCGNGMQEDFLVCYSKMLAVCPDHSSINPFFFDLVAMRSVVYGVCDNKRILKEGFERATNKSSLFNSFVGNCFNDKLYARALEAENSGNWTGFCSSTQQEVKCIDTVLRHFRSREDYKTVVRHFLYTILPSKCRDTNNENFTWAVKYGGLSEGCRMRAVASTIPLMIIAVLWSLMI